MLPSSGSTQLALEHERERAHAHVPDRGRLGHPGGEAHEQTARACRAWRVAASSGAAAADAVIVRGRTLPAGSMGFLTPDSGPGRRGLPPRWRVEARGGSAKARRKQASAGSRERVWGRLGVGPDVIARDTSNCTARSTGLRVCSFGGKHEAVEKISRETHGAVTSDSRHKSDDDARTSDNPCAAR